MWDDTQKKIAKLALMSTIIHEEGGDENEYLDTVNLQTLYEFLERETFPIYKFNQQFY